MGTVVDIVLILIYLLLASALIAVVWSQIRGLANSKGESVYEERLLKRISLIVVGIVALVIAGSLLFSSADAIQISGKMYTDSFWLRMSDVAVFSVIGLFFIFIIAAIAMEIRAYFTKG